MRETGNRRTIGQPNRDKNRYPEREDTNEQ
jgi:hypothetical protein